MTGRTYQRYCPTAIGGINQICVLALSVRGLTVPSYLRPGDHECHSPVSHIKVRTLARGRMSNLVGNLIPSLIATDFEKIFG